MEIGEILWFEKRHAPTPERGNFLGIMINAKHLMAYLDEMTWRFNNRKNLDWTPRLRQSVKLHFAVRCRSVVGRG